MGWASGSEIAEELWKTVSKYIPEKQKERVARKIVDIFEHADCDTMDECLKLMKAAGLENRGEDEDYD